MSPGEPRGSVKFNPTNVPTIANSVAPKAKGHDLWPPEERSEGAGQEHCADDRLRERCALEGIDRAQETGMNRGRREQREGSQDHQDPDERDHVDHMIEDECGSDVKTTRRQVIQDTSVVSGSARRPVP